MELYHGLYNGKTKKRVFRMGDFSISVDPRVRLVFILSRIPMRKWGEEKINWLNTYFPADWKIVLHPDWPETKEKIKEADLIITNFDSKPFRPHTILGQGAAVEWTEI